MKKVRIVILCLIIILAAEGCRGKEYGLPSDQNKKLANSQDLISSETEDFEADKTLKEAEKTLDIPVSNEERAVKVNPENTCEIIITGDGEEKILVNDSLNLITAVEQVFWLKPGQLIVIAHINPSLQCLLRYDIEAKQFYDEKYGIHFCWKDDDITSLVYIVPGPHFFKNGNLEMIKDYQDNILYQAGKNVTISELEWLNENEISFRLTDSSGREIKKQLTIVQQAEPS